MKYTEDRGIFINTVYYANVVNRYRKEENNDKLLTHDDVFRLVSALFDDLQANDLLEYDSVNISNEKTAFGKMIYILSYDFALELLVSESKYVRGKVIREISRNDREAKKTLADHMAAKEIQYEAIVPRDEYVRLDSHGMTANRLYEHNPRFYELKPVKNTTRRFEADGRPVTSQKMTPDYRNWLNNLPMHQIPNQRFWEDRGVDFTKPLHVRLGFVHNGLGDMINLEKAIIDVIFGTGNRGVIRVDDKNIHKITKESWGITKNGFVDGKIYFHISNV